VSAIDRTFDRRREDMVERQILARGVRSGRVLDAMRRVKREGYVPSYLGEFAYDDSALPIEEEQTISQPYIVAYMVDALDLHPHEKVLEVGTGSGYAAAVLAELAREVFTIERHEQLAKLAEHRLARDGYRNVRVRHGDGTLGWPEHAPFDAIVVAAGGPTVPESLREQLAIGGRLVIPVGDDVGRQHLVRVTRTAADRYTEERLADVRFVPLIGREGWHAPAKERIAPPSRGPLARLVAENAEAFTDVDGADVGPLLARIGDARIVLLGESTHGSSEFYRLRARITQALIERQGFTIVTAEADWPDAARVDQHVRDTGAPRPHWRAFTRFPAWMWRNTDVARFVGWLRAHNLRLPPDRRVRFAGLDLYAMHHSITAVLAHLERVDPEAAAVARQRYGCLTPWQSDPATYGRAVLTRGYRSCETEVVEVLRELLRQRLEGMRTADEAWFEALENARLVTAAETYYRTMYYGSHESWNLRDRHMYDCLARLLDFHGRGSKAVVWAHNSHVGDASATEMAARGEWNLGQLCRQEFRGGGTYLVGFGTDHGTVAAASHWDGPMERKMVRPAQPSSYERICHDTGLAGFFLPLRAARSRELLERLAEPRLQRAIGVIYRPETELASHYHHAVLPDQFDEFVWVDRTEAVQPLPTTDIAAGEASPFDA
jgi:protein-L-isoaspartate(D-aspartate) O-methyltransferase